MRRSLFTMAMLLLAACATSAPPPDPALAIAAFLDAFNNLDAGEMRKLFADDATAFLPFEAAGARLNGREAILQALEPMFAAERARSSHGAPYLKLVANDLNVQRIGRDAAIASFDVGNQYVHSRRTVILRAASGRWVIVHLHASNLRPASGPG